VEQHIFQITSVAMDIVENVVHYTEIGLRSAERGTESKKNDNE
jgi:hypothetical protein